MRNDNPQMGRQFLVQLRDVAKQLGLKESDVRPQTLKVHVKLAATANSVKFDIARKTGNHALDNLLQENDFFVGHSLALGILPVPVINSLEASGNAQPIFYPDPNIFTTAGSATLASEAQALEMVYNSTLRIETNQDIRVKDFPTNIFRDCPETQKAAALQNSYDTVPFKDLYTGLGFAGGNVNEIELKFPSQGEYSQIAGSATRINYAVLLIQGVLVVGGAQKATAGRIYQYLNGGK